MKYFGPYLPSVVAFAGAAVLAYHGMGIWGWCWFLIAGGLTYPSIRTGSAAENGE